MTTTTEIEPTSLEVLQAETELKSRIARTETELEALALEERDLKQKRIETTSRLHHESDRKTVAQLKNAEKILKTDIERNRITQKNQDDLLQKLKTDLATLQGARKSQHRRQNTELSAQSVFEDNNIHYVIFDQQWWSVDPTGSRMDIKINRSDSAVIKDLIFYDSNWLVSTEQELKQMAKDMGRVFKHIVRDFGSDARPGVYNQLRDIRKQWLNPIYDQDPHPAFRVLCESIAGGNADYADQLERWVAYRYCHPEDVMIPNLDSCATGGTGRDTLWNIIATIFTAECCGAAGEETFRGTHNGDLFGKMFVKIDEKDSSRIPIDKLKEYTGGTKYRDRQMQRDARDVVRLFAFLMFRNGYTTTARLAGTGSAGEDRRWEPIIARLNLNRHVARHFGLIEDVNTALSDDQGRACQMLIKEWQRDVYRNEQAISEWLGYCIRRHSVETMTELLPLHGVYYTEMLERQKQGIEGFMPKFLRLMQAGNTTVINLKDAHRLFETAESTKRTKDWVKNQIMYWLNSQQGWDCEEIMADVYPWAGAVTQDRRKMTVIVNRLARPTLMIWDIEDFIDPDAVDDKETTVGRKINIYSIKDELK